VLKQIEVAAAAPEAARAQTEVDMALPEADPHPLGMIVRVDNLSFTDIRVLFVSVFLSTGVYL
jgi:hypothetical protein